MNQDLYRSGMESAFGIAWSQSACLVSVFVIFVTRRIYDKLVVSMISKELAVASRIKVERINLIYLLLVATIVAVGIKEVGNAASRSGCDSSCSCSQEYQFHAL